MLHTYDPNRENLMQFISFQSNSAITSRMQYDHAIRRDNMPPVGHSARHRWSICGAINLSKGKSCIMNFCEGNFWVDYYDIRVEYCWRKVQCVQKKNYTINEKKLH
jgi:hypothetical protein